MLYIRPLFINVHISYICFLFVTLLCDDFYTICWKTFTTNKFVKKITDNSVLVSLIQHVWMPKGAIARFLLVKKCNKLIVAMETNMYK